MPPPPKTAIPAAFQAPGSALPTQPRDNKRKLELIAFALLLVGSGGYLAYAAHSHLWPFRSVPVKTNDTTNTGTPSAPQPKDSHNPEPQRNKPAARTQDHHPGAPHSDQPAAQPTAQPTNQPAEQNADQPTDRSANQPGNQHETQPSPQPQPSGQQPSNPQADQGHHLRRNIVIAGDVEPNRHHDLESPLLSIKHENRRECMALAKDHTVIYRHSGETAESILQRYPDIKGHIDERDHKLESRDLTADIRAACGQEFDVVVILARKPGQVSGMNPNPGTASNDPDHPAAAPRSKLRLQPMQ